MVHDGKMRKSKKIPPHIVRLFSPLHRAFRRFGGTGTESGPCLWIVCACMAIDCGGRRATSSTSVVSSNRQNIPFHACMYYSIFYPLCTRDFIIIVKIWAKKLSVAFFSTMQRILSIHHRRQRGARVISLWPLVGTYGKLPIIFQFFPREFLLAHTFWS